ncbi:hypothetical protein ABZS83_37285 [Streptomyces sp. NPDC005426]|uniref:hypothetical protein n=1 Tax=unclassified Streptomyces TaxID=2593676 RepID=UPI0033A9BCA5
MSTDTLEHVDHTRQAPVCPHDAPDAPGLAPGAVRPALLAGEEHDAPDPSIFRGTD